MTHHEQVSVLSHMHLQQAEEVKAQSQEICHLLALVEQQQEAIKKYQVLKVLLGSIMLGILVRCDVERNFQLNTRDTKHQVRHCSGIT